MKAIIFAAGKGTRLKPLTDNTPKALINVGNKPLLEHVILKLQKSGVKTIIINIHYLGHKIIKFLKEKNNFGLEIHISDERQLLLETGGGLMNAAHFFDKDEDFIAYNVDILSDIDLNEMMAFHLKNESLVTLAVKARKTSRYFLFDSDMQLQGWQNTHTGETICHTAEEVSVIPLAFSGIHIINSQIFDYITERGVFSITPLYIKLSQKHKIMGYRHDYTAWYDVGRKETLMKAEAFFRL